MSILSNTKQRFRSVLILIIPVAGTYSSGAVNASPFHDNSREKVLQRELIVVDPGLYRVDELLSTMKAGKSNRDYEVLKLRDNADSIEQISTWLQAAENSYSAIHIVSHGANGEVHLGNSPLTNDNLVHYCLLYTSDAADE